jgi:thermitase
MIAGIIARIAPNAKILPVRVLNGDGLGTMMNVAKGLHYAVKAGARVVTMSFGSLRLSEAMKDVVDEAKNAQVVMVAAAGNDGTDKMQFPALRSGVMAVTSVEANNVKSTYSSYGSAIQVVSPGTGIRSTYVNGGYANWSGTSFSVPFVAAEAALIVSRYPTADARKVSDSIRATAITVDNVNPSYSGELGKGIIDIEAGVKRVP